MVVCSLDDRFLRDWFALQSGARPPQQHVSEPGEWPHGWQYFASSASDHHFREIVLAQSCAADQAHLRSHSGAGASDVLCGCLSCLPSPLASAVLRWTEEDVTEQRVHVQGG